MSIREISQNLKSFRMSEESNNVSIDTVTLLQEIRELRQRLDDGESRPKRSSDLMPEVCIRKDPANTQGKLKPTKFPVYGGDKSMYPAWRRGVLAALKMDWNTFGYTDSRVFLMIYKALEGKAQRQASAFFESGGPDGEEKPEDFIRFLDRSNWDTTRIVRARNQLNRMKMGLHQRWNSFFPLWENKLTEAFGNSWPDETKITMLRGTLNPTLRTALANNHLIPSDDYFEWTRIVSQIAQQHDELQEGPVWMENTTQASNKGRQTVRDNQEYYSPPAAMRERTTSGRHSGLVGDLDHDGDMFMGGINTTNVLRNPDGKPLRAKWKSREQIDQLRRAGRCFRCELKGCNTAICRLLPAQKPRAKGPVISHVTLDNLDPSLYEIVENVASADEAVTEN